jgi:hypothetical protein
LQVFAEDFKAEKASPPLESGIKIPLRPFAERVVNARF